MYTVTVYSYEDAHSYMRVYSYMGQHYMSHTRTQWDVPYVYGPIYAYGAEQQGPTSLA